MEDKQQKTVLEKSEKIEEIPLSKIDVIENIRQTPIKDELSELMNSIKQDGLLQPIGVKKVKGKYNLLWGYRRLKAHEKLGYKTIPARVYNRENDILSESDFLVINTTENIHRKSINPVELGRICNIFRKKNLSVGEIAVRLSIPTGRVKSCLDEYQKIPAKYRDKIRIFTSGGEAKQRGGGAIPSSVATNILRVKKVNQKQRENLFKWALANDKNAYHISMISKLTEAGMPIDKAKQETENWNTMGLKFALRKTFAKNFTDKGSLRKYIVELINKHEKKEVIF